MKIQCVSDDLTDIKTDAAITFHFEGEKKAETVAASIDNRLDGAVSRMIRSGEITGKRGELTILHSFGKLAAGRIAILGLGKRKNLNADTFRGAIAGACRELRKRAVTAIACSTEYGSRPSLDPRSRAQAAVEGAVLGLYRFRRHITKPEKGDVEIRRFVITGNPGDEPQRKAGASAAAIIAEAVNWARDLSNEPGNHMTPARMAIEARKLSESHGLEFMVLEKEQMASAGMGALLGVARGSSQPPAFIVLKYKGRASDETDLALVGKGITFDSGGISIKTSRNMSDMKGDMAGGAAVMAALGAISRLKTGINAVACVPAAENMPGGGALKPGDVLTAMNGKTIEVINTDAEGRLILADALCYARQFRPGIIVDVATLTGACHVALGAFCTGVFGNDRRLGDMIVAAGEETGERMWQMPMFIEYGKLLKSDIADMKNTGNRWGAAITAAKFLENFVDGTRWAHLDIAGTSRTEKEKGYFVKGATGVPVRMLIRLAQRLAG